MHFVHLCIVEPLLRFLSLEFWNMKQGQYVNLPCLTHHDLVFSIPSSKYCSGAVSTFLYQRYLCNIHMYTHTYILLQVTRESLSGPGISGC